MASGVNKSLNRLVLVVWKDITARADWVGSYEEVLEEIQPIRCVTVGWIILDTKDTLILADSATQDRTLGGTTAIPKGVVVSIEEVRRESAASILKKATLRESAKKRKGKNETTQRLHSKGSDSGNSSTE